MRVRSATAQLGLSAVNSSSFAPPVATASVFAPMNFPQRTSNGVSPITTTSCGIQVFAQHTPAPGEGCGSDVITLFMVVGKTAKFELIPEVKMA